MFNKYPPLISHWIDPIAAITMGISAYYLYEKRINRPHNHTFNQLFKRRFLS